MLATAAESNWPAWRGELGTGIAPHTGVPTSWSADKNIKWKIALPAAGNSTPIVWKDRIFLTSANEDGSRRSLLCFARGDGKLLWQRDTSFEPKELTHETNPYAAASPVTDGERVIVWHGSAGVFAYDFEGRELWNKDLGKFTHIWGYAASPVIDGDRVILSCGPGIRCLLVVLDKRTGGEIWKRELAEAQAKKPEEFVGSWSTPVLHTSGGRKQLLLSLPQRAAIVRSGDRARICGPARGWARWPTLRRWWPAMSPWPCPAYHGAALACRTDGSGDVTDTHRLWLHEEKNPQRVGSGVIVGEHIYILNESGIAWCLELATGKKRWEKRIGAASWSSMVHVDGRSYVLAMDGETLVLKPNPDECEVDRQKSAGRRNDPRLAGLRRPPGFRAVVQAPVLHRGIGATRSDPSGFADAIAAIRQVGPKAKETGTRARHGERCPPRRRSRTCRRCWPDSTGRSPWPPTTCGRRSTPCASENWLTARLPAGDLEKFVLERSARRAWSPARVRVAHKSRSASAVADRPQDARRSQPRNAARRGGGSLDRGRKG